MFILTCEYWFKKWPKDHSKNLFADIKTPQQVRALWGFPVTLTLCARRRTDISCAKIFKRLHLLYHLPFQSEGLEERLGELGFHLHPQHTSFVSVMFRAFLKCLCQVTHALLVFQQWVCVCQVGHRGNSNQLVYIHLVTLCSVFCVLTHCNSVQ